MDELVRVSRKAAASWRGTDAYHQAAEIIDALCDRLENYKPDIRSQWEITDVDHAHGHKCFHCPECGSDEWRDDKTNFCPNCGTNMRGTRMSTDDLLSFIGCIPKHPSPRYRVNLEKVD